MVPWTHSYGTMNTFKWYHGRNLDGTMKTFRWCHLLIYMVLRTHLCLTKTHLVDALKTFKMVPLKSFYEIFKFINTFIWYHEHFSWHHEHMYMVPRTHLYGTMNTFIWYIEHFYMVPWTHLDCTMNTFIWYYEHI
jgi:hypothetical protein